MRITLIPIEKPEQIDLYWPIIKFFYEHVPYDITEEQIRNFVSDVIPNFVLVYADEYPIGCFTLEIFKKTVELHGMTNPDMNKVYGKKRANMLKAAVYFRFFHKIFQELGKKTVIAKVPPGAKGVKGFLLRHGFKSLSDGRGGIKMDDGRQVWKLEKGVWLERNGQKETIKGETVTSV